MGICQGGALNFCQLCGTETAKVKNLSDAGGQKLKVCPTQAETNFLGYLCIEQLAHYNAVGFIPGPSETEDEYCKRVHYCQGLAKEPLFQEGVQADHVDLLQSAFPLTKKNFDISPDWIPVFFSDYKLAPWHGATAWIFQREEDVPTGAFFQLRTCLQKQNHIFGMYTREELLAHEASHVGRMLFEEPKYEEMIAYTTSPSWLRRTFGPIVQSSWESSLFLLVLFFLVILDGSLLFTGQIELYEKLFWLKALPLGFCSAALIRLLLRRRSFKRCKQALHTVLGCERKASAVLYRLTDREIEHFSKFRKIMPYVMQQKDLSLRWKMIYGCYFV